MTAAVARLLVVGVVVVIACCFILLDFRRRRRRRRILEHGELVRGWIVQANTALFGPGAVDHPAMVLVSFEPGSDAQVAALARRMGTLSSQPAADEVESRVARLVLDHRYRPAFRRRLPNAFTGGLEVYSAHVAVRRALLPDRRLTARFLHCRAEPGESGEVMMCGSPEADAS
jgi:hypothetical protein